MSAAAGRGVQAQAPTGRGVQAQRRKAQGARRKAPGARRRAPSRLPRALPASRPPGVPGWRWRTRIVPEPRDRSRFGVRRPAHGARARHAALRRAVLVAACRRSAGRTGPPGTTPPRRWMQVTGPWRGGAVAGGPASPPVQSIPGTNEETPQRAGAGAMPWCRGTAPVPRATYPWPTAQICGAQDGVFAPRRAGSALRQRISQPRPVPGRPRRRARPLGSRVCACWTCAQASAKDTENAARMPSVQGLESARQGNKHMLQRARGRAQQPGPRRHHPPAAEIPNETAPNCNGLQ